MSQDKNELLGGRKRMLSTDDENTFHTIRFLEDVPVLMNVEIGRTTMTMRELLNLKKNSVVAFTKIVGEPMDILVGDRLMARGEVVVVNERYGIRISEVTRPEEKIGGRRE